MDNIQDKLKGLTEEEKKYVMSILKDMDNGQSKSFNDLMYEDYNEIPVDIETFITDDNYMGSAWKDTEGNLKLYPFWLDRLKELFPTNTDVSVNNFIESGARGLGKSEIACLCCAYLMYRVMCLKNPLEFYHLKPTEKICFALMNITKDLVKAIALDKFQKSIQMSPWFMSKGRMTTFENEPYWVPPEPIDLIMGSQPNHVIGLPIYFAFFDEIDFIKNQDIDKQKKIAMNMIDTAIGGMKTRFVHKGKNPTLLILASSKRSDKSFLEEHMKKKLSSEHENVIIVDEAVWAVKPKGTYSDKTFKVALGNKFLQSKVLEDNEDLNLYWRRGYKILDIPVDFKANFLDDIERALCDYAGIASTELSKYISGQAVQDCINPNRLNPFAKDILEIGNAPDDRLQYYNFFDKDKIPMEWRSKPLYIHLDMSISGDKTGIAGVFAIGKKHSVNADDQSKDMFYGLAFNVSIKAPKGRQVSFEKNRKFIYWLKDQGYNIKGISTDTFQSYDTGQQLQALGYPYKQISVDRVDSDHVCLTGDSLVNTILGPRKIKDLLPGDEVYSYNIDTDSVERDIITSWEQTAIVNEYLQIETENGKIIQCTPNHMILTSRGYVKAEDLTENDEIVDIY